MAVNKIKQDDTKKELQFVETAGVVDDRTTPEVAAVFSEEPFPPIPILNDQTHNPMVVEPIYVPVPALIPEYLLMVKAFRRMIIGGVLNRIMKHHGTDNGYLRMTEAGHALQIILDEKRQWECSPTGNSNRNANVKQLVGLVIVQALDALYSEIQRAMNENEKITADDLVEIELMA